MVTGIIPWSEYTNPLTAMYQIVSSEKIPTIPENLSNDVKIFIQIKILDLHFQFFIDFQFSENIIT